MNVFLKIAAFFPVLIYLVIGPTVQEAWGSQETNSARFLSNLMIGDKLPSDAFNSISPSLNFTKPFNISSLESGLGGNTDIGTRVQNFITSFVNQTRSTVGLVARHGNFTLIQAALLFTIGCMAGGAALLVLEGLAFRQRETEIELYKSLQGQHSNGAYGPPPVPSSSYGTPSAGYQDSYSSAHSEPIPSYEVVNSYPSQPDLSAYYGTNSRKKRDTGQLGDGTFIQLSKPYRNPYTRTINRFQNDFRPDSSRKYAPTFAGATTYSGFIGPSSPLSNYGYPDSTNYLMLNRLGMKRRHHGSKTRVQNGNGNGDDEMEYARGIPIDEEGMPLKAEVNLDRKRKYKKSRKGEDEGFSDFIGGLIVYPPFIDSQGYVPRGKRLRKYEQMRNKKESE